MKFNWKPVGPSSLSLTGESLREIIQELEDPVDAEMFKSTAPVFFAFISVYAM